MITALGLFPLLMLGVGPQLAPMGLFVGFSGLALGLGVS